MRDLFPVPMSPVGLFHNLITMQCKNKNKYLAHAINEHDRLADENAALKRELEMLKSGKEGAL